MFNMVKKVFVHLSDGLGNQMFQYAFGVSLKKRCGVRVYYDNAFFLSQTFRKYALHCFGIKIKKYSKTSAEKRSELQLKMVKEKQDSIFDESLYHIENNNYYKGYFQSYKYIAPYRKDILKIFRPVYPLDDANQEILDKIKSVNAVSLHVRRTDYLKEKELSIRGICNPDYYEHAVQYIKQHVENPVFFIFSDDIEWCRENIDPDTEHVFVDINDGEKGYFDMFLMKNCKHNIIANSSFSWWGAWLNEHPEKIVIAPKIWMLSWNEPEENAGRDLIPPEWIRL